MAVTESEIIVGREYDIVIRFVTDRVTVTGISPLYVYTNIGSFGLSEFKAGATLVLISGIDIISGEYDPCEGVVCSDICVGVDKYSQLCVDGVCVQGPPIESNSTACGYIPPPPAKGRIDNVSYIACHAQAGCSSEIAYWDSDVTVSVGFTNIGGSPGEFKARLIDKSNNTAIAESAFQSIGVNATGLLKPLFIMPHVELLSLKLELIRNE